MPSKPKAGYPVANNTDQNTKPINSLDPSQWDGAILQRQESYPRHPLTTQSGTKQSQASVDYVRGQ